MHKNSWYERNLATNQRTAFYRGSQVMPQAARHILS